MKAVIKRKRNFIFLLSVCFAICLCLGCITFEKSAFKGIAEETSSSLESAGGEELSSTDESTSTEESASANDDSSTDDTTSTEENSSTDDGSSTEETVVMHYCSFLVAEMYPLTQAMIDEIIAENANAESESTESESVDAILVYLTEDVEWDGALKGIDGNTIYLCLNGYKAEGKIDNSNANRETGNKFIVAFDCTEHICAHCDDARLFTQSFVDMLEAQGGEADISQFGNEIALYEDITLNLSCWMLTSAITVCLNGHTISCTNGVDFSTLSGVTVVDCNGEVEEHVCSAIGGQEFVEITKSNLDDFAEKVLNAENGSVFYAELQTNVIFMGENKSLVIPDGVTVHLCLNNRKMSGGYEYSEEKQENLLYCAIIVKEGGEIIIYDCSTKGNGIITFAVDVGGEIVDGKIAALHNEGKCTLKGGVLFGVSAITNAGTFTMEGGKLIGIFWGVAHSGHLFESTETAVGKGTTYMNGGEIYSLGGSLYVASGTLYLNGGTAYGLSSKGLIAGWTDSSATVYFNDTYGGTLIHVGACKVVEEKFLWLIGRLSISESEINIDFNHNSTGPFVGVEIHEGTSIILNAEPNIKISGGYVDVTDTISDFTIVDDSRTDSENNVIANDFGKIVVNTKLTKTYFVLGDEEVTDGHTFTKNAGDYESTNKFAPAEGYDTKIVDGEVTLYYGENPKGSTEEGTEESIAKLAYVSVTPEADLLLNLYVLPDAAYNAETTKFYVRYKETLYEYNKSGGEQKDSYLRYSINVSAKDHGEVVCCYFSDGTQTWGSKKVSVEQYLIDVEATEGLAEKTLNVVNALQRYCESASVYFEIQNDFSDAYNAETETIANVTAEDLAAYAPSFDTLPDGVQFIGASLFLTTKVGLRLYFEVTPEYIADLQTSGLYSTDGGTTTHDLPVKSAVGVADGYYVEIRDISAEDLGVLYLIDLNGYKINYGVLSCVYTILMAKSPDPYLLEVCKNLYRYYVAVCEFNAPVETEEGGTV